MKKIFLSFFIISIFCIFLFFTGKNLFFSQKIYTTSPSNENIFTQGIFWKNGSIIISGGWPREFSQAQSVVGILEKNGNFVEKFRLDKNIFFGEGIAELDGKIFFLTWKNQKWFILNAENFEKIWEFSYENAEWWGLTSDEEKLFLSDGTDKITIFNKNFKKIWEFSVTENGKKITKINELEYIDQSIFANIWLTNDIIQINATTGKVENRWNFDDIKMQEKSINPNAQEMNGIAFNKAKNEIILTGKMWKNLYIFPKKFFIK